MMSKDNVEILLRKLLRSNEFVIESITSLSFHLSQHTNLMMENLANQDFIIHLKEFELGLIDEDALLEYKNSFEEEKDRIYEYNDEISENISKFYKEWSG